MRGMAARRFGSRLRGASTTRHASCDCLADLVHFAGPNATARSSRPRRSAISDQLPGEPQPPRAGDCSARNASDTRIMRRPALPLSISRVAVLLGLCAEACAAESSAAAETAYASLQDAIDRNPGRRLYVPAGDHVIKEALQL